MELIDIGCNLTHDSFNSDLDDVLEKARDAGVVQMIVTGASDSGSRKALELARSRPGILYATAGVHPHRASDYDDDTDALLRKLSAEDEVVAVGETGLDYFRDFSPRDVQREVFQRQLAIGRESGLVHCFTDSRAALVDYLDMDCHIGITGWICDERRGTHMKEFLPEIPADRLLVETDAPYLKPRNLRPRVKSHRNEPRWLPWIVGTLAAVRNVHPETLAAQTTENARRFFRISKSA